MKPRVEYPMTRRLTKIARATWKDGVGNPFEDPPMAGANRAGEECQAHTFIRNCHHPRCCHGGHGRHKKD